MTTIPFSAQSSLRSYMKSLPQLRFASDTKVVANEAKTSAQANVTTKLAATSPTDGVRGVKVAINQKGLIDSRTALAIAQGGVLPHPVIEESVADTKATTTKSHAHILPIKVPVATTDPVTIAEDQPPVKAPPGGIWTPYDPVVAQAPLDDGGFTVSIGPDGRAICGGGSGPFYVPPPTEEM